MQELAVGQSFFQAVRHRALGLAANQLDFGSGNDVRFPVFVAQRQRLCRLGDFYAAQYAAAVQRDGQRRVAGGDGAAGLQQRLDEMNLREAAADAGQVRADASALLPQPMAFDALPICCV